MFSNSRVEHEDIGLLHPWRSPGFRVGPAEKQGPESRYVQMPMGHSTGKVTTEYQEAHEITYESVEAELSLEGLEI